MEFYNEQQAVQHEEKDHTAAANLAKVYGFFALDLLISGIMAMFFPNILVSLGGTEDTYYISMVVFAVLMIVTSLTTSFSSLCRNPILIGLSATIYAISLGGLCSSFTLFIEAEYVFYAFLVTGGAFLIMALVGFITKGRLSKWLYILLTGAMAIAFASLINVLFFNNNMMNWIFSMAIIVIYLLVASIDTSRVLAKAKSNTFKNNTTEAMYEAFLLYTDFMIIFMYIMRIVATVKGKN